MKKISAINYILLFFLICFFMVDCKKVEGPGGTSTINGKIIVHDFDAAFLITTPVIYPATNTETYIIYGANHSTYDNNYKTTYDGSYEFKYLQKGKYRIFAYSIDSTGAYKNNPSLAQIPAFVDVEITSNGSTVSAPDLIILKNKR